MNQHIDIKRAIHDERIARYRAEARAERFRADARARRGDRQPDAERHAFRRAVGRSIIRFGERIAAERSIERLEPTGSR